SRRQPGYVREPQVARRHRLHPGAHRQLLQHRHGRPRHLRQRHPDPPAGEGRQEGDGMTAATMAKRKPTMKAKDKAAKTTTATKKRYEGFTDEEKAAMMDRVQEQKIAARKAEGESDLLAQLAEMPEPDRAMAQRLHAVIKASAPALSPTTWYG